MNWVDVFTRSVYCNQEVENPEHWKYAVHGIIMEIRDYQMLKFDIKRKHMRTLALVGKRF